MGLQRVEHDWVTVTELNTEMWSHGHTERTCFEYWTVTTGKDFLEHEAHHDSYKWSSYYKTYCIIQGSPENRIGAGPLPLKRFITRKSSYECCEVSRSAYGDQEQLMLSSSLSSKAWSTRRASGVNSGRKPIGLRAKNSVSCSTLNLKEGK